MIYEFSQIRDWTHFLPPNLMCIELCLWKIWLGVHLCLHFLIGTANVAPSSPWPWQFTYECKIIWRLFIFLELFLRLWKLFRYYDMILISWQLFSAKIILSAILLTWRSGLLCLHVPENLAENLLILAKNKIKEELTFFEDDEIIAKIKCLTKK